MNNDNVTPEQLLQDAGGAILWWQVPDAMLAEFERAYQESRIHFDPESDCYLHPEAVLVADGGWAMPGEYQ